MVPKPPFPAFPITRLPDYVDGVPITGTSATMPIASGNLAGLATRDNVSVTYQAQLDGIAGGLINAFAESDQAGTGPNLPGLFTTLGAMSLPLSYAEHLADNPKDSRDRERLALEHAIGLLQKVEVAGARSKESVEALGFCR